jgi:hypothetical protein
MDTGTFNPRVMYNATGSTRRVDNGPLADALEAQGWAFVPFPPPPEAPKLPSIQDQITELRDLVMQHDALLMKRKQGGK